MSLSGDCGCPRNTILVSGIPPGITYNDLRLLFCTVVQVRDLKFFPLQGKALMALYDPSSVDFITNYKDWTLSGITLTTRRTVQCHSFCKRLKVKDRKNKPDDMRCGFMALSKPNKRVVTSRRDSFWSDIPHEKSLMATKKRKRRKVKYPLRNYCKVFPKNTAKSSCFKMKKHPRFIKKTENVDTWESDFNYRKERQQPFHLYVKYNGTFRIEFLEHPSLSEIRQEISKISKVPLEFQLITYRGKLLRSSMMKNLWSADTLHLLVRGKGGMKAAADSGDANLLAAKEKEVRDWLLSFVPSEVINKNKNFEYLDGTTLNEYHKVKNFMEDMDVSAGLAKKILYMRDNFAATVAEIPIETLSNIAPEQIKDMVCDCLEGEKGTEISVQLFQEEADGLVLMLYEDHKLFADDFSIPKIAAKRILNTIQTKIKEQCKKESVQNEKKEEKTSLSVEEHHPVKVNPEFESSDLSSKESTVIKDKLAEVSVIYTRTGPTRNDHISRIKPQNLSKAVPHVNDEFLGCLGFEKSKLSPDHIKCNLVGIHNSLMQENQNELQKLFMFWILCKNQNDVQTKHECNKLWKIIHRKCMLWIKTLPPEKQKLWKETGTPGKIQYRCSKTFKLGEYNAKVFPFNDVVEEKRKRFERHILIIHDSIDLNCDRPLFIEVKKDFYKFDTNSDKYWIFSGLDGDGDIQERFIESNQQEDEKDSLPLAADTVLPKDSDIDSQSDPEKSEGFTDMKKTDSESFKLKPEFQLDHGIELQNTRIFKEDGSSVVYMKGSVIRPECGGDVGMLIPSIEFKYFVQAVKKGYFVEKFLKETLRFACGCLNRRCNGTIYFGVADDKEVDGQKYKHGEIVGFPINNIESENIMSTFTDKLDHAKENYFSSDSKRAAKECISSPRFVLVQPSTRELPGYVMEVDIEPSIIFCEGVIFRVDLSKFGEKNKKSVVCVRDGASTKYIEDKRDKEIFTLSLKKYDKKRNQEESIGPKHLKKVRSHKYLAEKLCFKLCKGSAAFDQSLWPILLCNKPTLEKKRTLFKHLSFIEHIKWSAVMDFDDESCIDGLYRHLFVSSKTKEIDCTHFRNISSTDRFRSDLELAEKIAYIFCNGRQEIDLPHGSEKFWEEKYSPGVKGAVNFLQQDSIIPVDRSIVVFLLLSTDFAGYVDTLKEIKTYFPVDNILLLCEDDKIFEAFKQTSLPRNIASEEELEKFSIVGMSFEQVSNVVKKLLCIQQNSLVLIPSSTRVEVEVEKQFSDSHDCLSILASNECETKQFDTDLEKMQFAHSKDLRFYQGNRVEWWNFHFEGHVVKRSCFDNLKEKVEDALRGSHSENMSVLTIYLTHEPGAGGSTLAKHILWEFRKRHRCAIIKKLTEKTATDIVDLWKYKEIKEEHAVPVLLLIDSLEIKEKELYVIHQLIGKEMRKRESKNQTPVCVFIVCNRDAELTFAKASAHMDAKYREYLLQGVDTREQELFKKKIKDLDEVSHALGIDDFKAEHFLSFMILHSNFNPEYIQQTTKTLLQTMDPESKSYELLKCVALFVAFVDPPKGGAPTAIPLECCDSLMGCESHFEKKTKTLRWESNLERAIKILLRIEKKEYGSGEEIRMAHPILAREVIECMKHQNKHYDAQDVKETALSKIVMKVLESKLLQSRSYSIKLVKGLIVQMLTKRKKEEYGDADTSKFSPLIESIQEENPSVCEPAIAVLQKAFDVIGDGSISQQMARLYLSHHNHLDAKKWAQKAVDLCPSRSPFIHTLGHVYKETFKSSKLYQGKAYLDPNDEQFSLELNNVFKALEYFIKAIWNENEINLFACFDTVETINIIVEFISKFLDQNQKKQFYRYLTEDSYDFDFIDKSYLSCYRLMLKQFFDQGMQAIHDLDEHIFFKVKIYASQFHSMFSKEHHTSRVIKKRLPKLIRRFFDVFCEDSDVKPSYVQSPEMEDEWHRRCVLRSQAKRLIGMCSFVHQCFVERHCDKARRVLEKAYDHLVDIKSKDSSDLLGLLIINFANVQLKADKSDKIKISMHELVKYCQFVISNGTKKQKREGHLFALMLSWPRNEKDDVQKYKLIEKAMHFLASGFKDSQETRLTYEVEYGDYFKRERNMVRSIPLFYEAVGTGLACLKYQDEVLDSKHFQDIREDFWERKSAIFRPLEGIARIAPNGSAYIQLGHEDNMIKLRLFKCRKPSSERKVIFYLGFTAFGPAVVYIKPENKLLDSLEIYDDKPDYENKSEEELKKLLEDIKTAKQSLKQKQKLTPYQNKIFEAEFEIKEAMLQYEEMLDLLE